MASAEMVFLGLARAVAAHPSFADLLQTCGVGSPPGGGQDTCSSMVAAAEGRIRAAVLLLGRGRTAAIVPIRAGNLAMCYPEANAIVPRELDPVSRTPAFKSVRARLTPLWKCARVGRARCYPPGFGTTAAGPAMFDELKDRVTDLHRRLTHVKDSL